ncbi:uncharacterized protein LOC128630137 [Ictalurus punctatus]|uniref:E3 ubiquitin-protein ligase n=1 Tax=Ictalurus punctatus TaxID=7998 RepID=A0A9F7QXA6_ICTPU|nr:uncharacterized protein LOC128630137 [Ictalurus punctatus]
MRILCHEAQEILPDGTAMVLAAFVQRSTVMSENRKRPPHNPESYDPLFMHPDLSFGTHTGSCGHIMHSHCWQRSLNINDANREEKYNRTKDQQSEAADRQDGYLGRQDATNDYAMLRQQEEESRYKGEFVFSTETQPGTDRVTSELEPELHEVGSPAEFQQRVSGEALAPGFDVRVPVKSQVPKVPAKPRVPEVQIKPRTAKLRSRHSPPTRTAKLRSRHSPPTRPAKLRLCPRFT